MKNIHVIKLYLTISGLVVFGLYASAQSAAAKPVKVASTKRGSTANNAQAEPWEKQRIQTTKNTATTPEVKGGATDVKPEQAQPIKSR